MELILPNAQNYLACPMFVLYKLLLQRTCFFVSVTFSDFCTEGKSCSAARGLPACSLQRPEQSEVHLPGVGSSLTALLMSLRANTTHYLLQIQTEFITLGQFKKRQKTTSRHCY